MNVLLIEDNEEIARYICKGLKELGHTVEWVVDGRDGFIVAIEHKFDVCIIDRLLPNMDGLSIVKGLRAANITTPALFLSALAAVDDRVEGLTSGADDYLVKPFALSELDARLNLLQCRQRNESTSEVTEIKFGNLTLNLLSRKVNVENTELELKGKEFAILEKLLRSPRRVHSRTMLLEQIWGVYFDTKTNVIDVHISNLRKKIEATNASCYVKTIRGVGYSIERKR